MLSEVKPSPYAALITKEMKEAVLEVLNSGHYTRGMQNRQFEREFAECCGTRYAVAVSSGSAALHLALLACKIGAGDEVITCPNSVTTAADMIMNVGARPVFVEPDEEIFTIDPERIEEKISSKTKAILLIHMYGHPAEMDAIMEIAQKHGLIVIEDGAHATGASYKGKKVGSTHENNITCFSFMNKCMTVCGDGGMAVTSNEELSNSMKLHRYLGQDEVFTWQERIYLSKVIGFNYRMSEIAAAVGRIMLKKLPELNENRRRVAAVYADVLKGVSDLSLPAEKPWAYSTYLWYVVRTKDSKKNDALREFLREKGIVGTEVPYKIPIHLQPVYRRDYGYKEGDFPITEREKKECFSLSTRPPFSLEEARRNAEAVKEFFRRS